MEYIQELPPIRVPRPGAVLVKTGHRLLGFLEEAFPIFVVASVALFALERLGVLHALEGVLRPVVVGWLGLPIRMVEVLILTLARHEAAGNVRAAHGERITLGRLTDGIGALERQLARLGGPPSAAGAPPDAGPPP